jgi:hypothetical protein
VKATLPAGRDAKIAGLVKKGAACHLDDKGRISSSCAEVGAAMQYADKKSRSAKVAATCAELTRHPHLAVRQVAARCIARMTVPAVTPVVGHVLDSIEAENHEKVRWSLATSLGQIAVLEAKLEQRVLAMIDTVAEVDEETAYRLLISTLGPADGKPPKEVQDFVVKVMSRKKGDLFYHVVGFMNLVEDKPAACKALAAAASPASGTHWSRALEGLNDLTTDCAGHAAAVLEKIIAKDEWILDRPEELTRLATKVELTPDLRKRAAAALTRARRGAGRAGRWKAASLDHAVAEFSKPWVKP